MLVEKPMAMSAEEAKAMVAAEEQSQGTLTMGFQYRLGAEAQILKRFSKEGQFGDVLFARVQAMRRRGVPNWGVFGRKELQGGGPLIDIGVHLIECAHFLMGEPKPVAASAQMFTYMGDKPSDVDSSWSGWDYKTYTVEDLAVGFVRFENGATMAIESSFIAHAKDAFNVQIMGTEGGCTLHPVAVFKDEAGTMVNIEPGYVPKYNSMAKKMDDWIARIRGERETQCPARAGLMVQEILQGLYDSAAAGKEVRNPLIAEFGFRIAELTATAGGPLRAGARRLALDLAAFAAVAQPPPAVAFRDAPPPLAPGRPSATIRPCVLIRPLRR